MRNGLLGWQGSWDGFEGVLWNPFWKCLVWQVFMALWRGFTPFWMVKKSFRIMAMIEFYSAHELFDEMPNRGLSVSNEP